MLTSSICLWFQCWTGVGVLRENEALIFNGLMLDSTDIRCSISLHKGKEEGRNSRKKEIEYTADDVHVGINMKRETW